MVSNDSFSLKATMSTIRLGILTLIISTTVHTSEAFRLPNVRRTNVWCQPPHKVVSQPPSSYFASFITRPIRSSSSQLASAVNNVDWGRKTVLQLQKELRSRGLSDKGSKTLLIQRLEALNTVKDYNHKYDDNDTKRRLTGSKSINGQSASQPSSSYEGSGASSYATSSYTSSQPASADTAQATKPRPSFAQNQTMVDMDSDEARRIENYLRKVKQQQRIKRQRQQQQQQQPQQQQRPPQKRPPRVSQHQQQEQRPPQQRPQRTAQTSYDAGQQRAADPFMTGRTPLQPPTPPATPPTTQRQETIIDVTSTATYTKTATEKTATSSYTEVPRPAATQRHEDDIYDGAAFASSQQANWGRHSFKATPRPPPTTPPTTPPAKFAEQTVTATSTTFKASKQPSSWSGTSKKTKESREFLSFDKDDFLRPYDAVVDNGSSSSVDSSNDNAAPTSKVPQETNGSVDDTSELFPELNTKKAPDVDNQDAIEVVSSSEDETSTSSANGQVNGHVNGDNEKEMVNGKTAPVNGSSSFGDVKQDTPKEVFFFDTQSEEAKTNGAAVEEGLLWSEEPNPFEVLSIEPGASMAEIRAAYRRKAMELSIDNNAEESEELAQELRQVVAAFQVLSGGYKKGKYEKEYQMLQRLKQRQEKEQDPDEEDSTDSSPLLKDLLPSAMLEQVSRRFNASEPVLLPVQKECYNIISEGEDVVLHAPAESGKTIGYLLPLLAKLPKTRNATDTGIDEAVVEELIGSSNKRGRRRKKNRRNKLAAEVQELSKPCKPTLVFVAPSKDVALEIGKLCSQYHDNEDGAVAIVFDGVPVKKQKTLLQKSGLEVVVGTPARLLKYIEMGVLDPAGIKTIAIDEADNMVEHLKVVEDLLVSIPSDDVQKVLTSVEMPSELLEFCEENMALTPKSANFITVSRDKDELQAKVQDEALVEEVEDDTSDVEESEDSIKNDSENDIITVEVERSPADIPIELNTEVLAAMKHWHTATRPSDRPILSLDIIASMSPVPKVVALFVPSDEDVEVVASELELFHDTLVKTLVEDSTDESRAEILDSIRAHSDSERKETMILVASDAAAASESDLPPADLVLQYGIPRQSKNSNLYDANRYMTRVQRACGDNKSTQAMLLYDYEEEGRLLPGLQTEMEVDCGIVLKPRALPSPQHTLEASYLRTKAYCDTLDCIPMVVESFEKQLKEELAGMDDMDREDELYHRLAVVMAALSNPAKLKEED